MPRNKPISDNLISPEYRRLNIELHQLQKDYGANAHAFVEGIRIIARNSEAKTLLDYGCGKGTLGPLLTNEGAVLDSYLK